MAKHDYSREEAVNDPFGKSAGSANERSEGPPEGMQWLDSLLFSAAPAILGFAFIVIALVGLASDTFVWVFVDLPLALVIWLLHSRAGGKH